MTLELKHAPGTPDARVNGCICPIEENQGGLGVAHAHLPEAGKEARHGTHFCIAQECPVHGFDPAR